MFSFHSLMPVFTQTNNTKIKHKCQDRCWIWGFDDDVSAPNLIDRDLVIRNPFILN